MNKKLAKNVLEMLMSSDFEKWYETKFMDFVEGYDQEETEAEILEWLSDHLR